MIFKESYRLQRSREDHTQVVLDGERAAYAAGLKLYNLDACWKPIGLRCRECGKEGRRVGTAFQAPPRTDIVAWSRLREWVESDGERKERESKSREIRRERYNSWLAGCQSYARDKEKRKRIEILQQAVKLGVRTSEEERRLAVIREKKGKVDDDAWMVVAGSSQAN
jgi:hypothetical protein